MEQRISSLKGVNLGGWLMMEGYLLGGRNIAESIFKGAFKRKVGARGLKRFEELFRDSFIREADFKNIAALGAQCVRLPFNCRLLEPKSLSYDTEGFRYLDRAFRWAAKYGLKIILDLHAAPGAQNCDWHGDSAGKALLWQAAHFRERTYELWEVLADRYKHKKELAGYDVLNEPVLSKHKIPVLSTLYRTLIKRIKAIDKNHTIFLEGYLWAQEVDFLEPLLTDGVAVSIHTYQPLGFTFHFTPVGRYPGTIEGSRWSKTAIYRYLKRYYDFKRRNEVDIFVGEFGVNSRANADGEEEYLEDLLTVFDEYGFGYTYWTYKAMAGYLFPDGVYRFIPNTSCVRRQGPVTGWENYLDLWSKNKDDMVQSWRTENYTPNKSIIRILKKHFTRK